MNTIGRDYLTAIRSFELVEEKHCGEDPWRLHFHIMPPAGWLNDPNGLAFYKGKYYVYFQYSPFHPEGGMKCWGLYTSTDMVHWNYEGVKLLPDEPFDVHGVYSGSALVQEDGLYLYYTGNVKKKGDYDYIRDGREANTVCVRTADGVSYEEKQLLMTNSDYGDGLTCHVRDPKVWEEDGRYYMVQGARDLNDRGKILLFQSDDRINWNYEKSLEHKEFLGYMWECPDVFYIGGQWILCFSPQGMEARGDEFQNIYQSGYCFLDASPREDCRLSEFQELDHGFDYYAPQSFLSPDGRRIQIGWMGLPDIQGLYENPTVARGWQHGMTVPRELTVEKGMLLQNPVEEMCLLRNEERAIRVTGSCQIRLDECFELQLKRTEGNRPFEMVLDSGLIMTFDPEEKRFEIKFISEIGEGRRSRSVRMESMTELQMLVDTSSVEIFLNGGRQVFTTRIYKKISGHQLLVTDTWGDGWIWPYLCN